MVRGGACLEGLEGDLFREVSVLIFLGLGGHRTVGVGQYTITDYPCARSDENVVYPAGCEAVGIKAVGCSIESVANLANLITIVEDPAGNERRVDRIVLVHIEISCQDNNKDLS